MVYQLYPLQETILKDRLKHERDLRRVFQKKIDLTPTIKEEARQRLHNGERDNWLVVQINGETGSMKSSVGIAFNVEVIDETFDETRVTQEYQTLIDKVAASKPGESFLLDEMIFQQGTGSVRVIENLINLIETLRKRKNSLTLITPTEKFINDNNVTFTLEPCGFDPETKTVRCLVRKNGRYIGFYYQKLLWNDPIWERYGKIKEEFIERSSKQTYKKIDYEKMAMELIVIMPEAYMKKKRRIKLFVEKHSPNLVKEERDLLIEQIEVLLDDEEFIISLIEQAKKLKEKEEDESHSTTDARELGVERSGVSNQLNKEKQKTNKSNAKKKQPLPRTTKKKTTTKKATKKATKKTTKKKAKKE